VLGHRRTTSPSLSPYTLHASCALAPHLPWPLAPPSYPAEVWPCLKLLFSLGAEPPPQAQQAQQAAPALQESQQADEAQQGVASQAQQAEHAEHGKRHQEQPSTPCRPPAERKRRRCLLSSAPPLPPLLALAATMHTFCAWIREQVGGLTWKLTNTAVLVRLGMYVRMRSMQRRMIPPPISCRSRATVLLYLVAALLPSFAGGSDQAAACLGT